MNKYDVQEHNICTVLQAHAPTFQVLDGRGPSPKSPVSVQSDDRHDHWPQHSDYSAGESHSEEGPSLDSPDSPAADSPGPPSPHNQVWNERGYVKTSFAELPGVVAWIQVESSSPLTADTRFEGTKNLAIVLSLFILLICSNQLLMWPQPSSSISRTMSMRASTLVKSHRSLRRMWPGVVHSLW